MRHRVKAQSRGKQFFSDEQCVCTEEICQLRERGSHYKVLRKRFAEIRDQIPILSVRSSTSH